MVASAARIEANRKNAARSTGPRTPEGKERSRGNAMTHGLRASVLDHPDDASARLDPAGSIAFEAPGSARFDEWLLGQMALAASKLDRCQEMEMAARRRVILRASVTWDDDRKLDAIRLASKLAGRPEEVVAGLRETVQGCDWLISRWEMLAHAATTRGGEWTPEQSRLADDLLGKPGEFRSEFLTIQPGQVSAAVARRALDELAARRAVLVPLDREARERAEAGLSDDDAEVRRLRRYEAELRRGLKWTLGVLGLTSQAREGPDRPAEVAQDQAPEPVAEPRRVPVDRPAAIPSRAERRLLKAESRRESRHRKLEQLRD